MRRSYRQMERDELVLRDAFESVFEATSGTRHFKRSSAEHVGYQVLLLAELSGHYDLIADSREKLGRILLLKYGKDPTVPERVREALRLLRGAQATKALQSALVWVRGVVLGAHRVVGAQPPQFQCRLQVPVDLPAGLY